MNKLEAACLAIKLLHLYCQEKIQVHYINPMCFQLRLMAQKYYVHACSCSLCLMAIVLNCVYGKCFYGYIAFRS
jgi:hypothetical protein